jgi:hypothetical protein
MHWHKFSTVSHYGKSHISSYFILVSLATPNLCPDGNPTHYLPTSRHSWGIEANQEQAVHYLSMAASNSAEIEKLALGAGMKKGGAAKGELVLAMYELANCFRNGWGIKKDPAAAKQYYETAANLGDTDAMNEVAWCYTEGFGTKKDKVCLPNFLCLLQCVVYASASPITIASFAIGYTSLIANGQLRRLDLLSHHAGCWSETALRILSPLSPASLFGQQCQDVVRLMRMWMCFANVLRVDSSKRRSSYDWLSPRETRL